MAITPKKLSKAGYAVLKNGKIKGKNVPYMKPVLDTGGFYSTSFAFGKTGHRTKDYFHRVVAKVYVPNPDKLRRVTHINGDKSDNRASNLRWV